MGKKSHFNSLLDQHGLIPFQNTHKHGPHTNTDNNRVRSASYATAVFMLYPRCFAQLVFWLSYPKADLLANRIRQAVGPAHLRNNNKSGQSCMHGWLHPVSTVLLSTLEMNLFLLWSSVVKWCSKTIYRLLFPLCLLINLYWYTLTGLPKRITVYVSSPVCVRWGPHVHLSEFGDLV